jgi:hypothetical protein
MDVLVRNHVTDEVEQKSEHDRSGSRPHSRTAGRTGRNVE